MSRADFNFANNFSESNGFSHNFQGFEDVWQNIDDISTISFELLLPKESLIQKKDDSDSKDGIGRRIFETEELLMRQNLVDLAMKENITVRENKKNPYVDLLVKNEKDIFSKEFAGQLPQMTEDDIKFFELIAGNGNISINNTNSVVVEGEDGQKTLENLKFSKSLMNLIEYSYSSGRPVRIDFSKDLTVILKIDRQGQISAEFISSDKAMEHLLRTNIPYLKQKLDSSGIKYKKIYYKDDENEGE